MANYLVNSPGLLTEGTSAADLLQIESAAVSATTVKAGAGNDTITALVDGTSADQTQLYGEGGADQFDISATTFSASTIFGGAGGDTVNINFSTTWDVIKGGDGSDDVTVQSGSTILGDILMGAGADDVIFSSNFTFTTSQIALGAGKDTIEIDDGNLSSTTIIGGGGDDSIDLAGSVVASALSITGGNGADTIQLDSTGEMWSVAGGNGADVISAVDLQSTSQILGGGGADDIQVTTISGNGISVYGGAGADTIDIDTANSADSAQIMGGGGADSIEIGHTDWTDVASAEVYGGAGADSITLTGEIVSGQESQFAYAFSSYADSTEDVMDVYTVAAVEHSGSLVFRNDSDNLSAGVVSASTASGTLGIVSFSSTTEYSSIEERVAFLNDELASAGDFAIFQDSDNSAAYLFIQGGATDLVAKITSTDDSITIVSASATTKTLTFTFNT